MNIHAEVYQPFFVFVPFFQPKGTYNTIMRLFNSFGVPVLHNFINFFTLGTFKYLEDLIVEFLYFIIVFIHHRRMYLD